MKGKLPLQPAFKRKIHKKLNPTRNSKKTVEMKKKVQELKQKKKAQKEAFEAEIQSVPRSLIIGRGQTLPKDVEHLIIDLRRIMMPYTAMKFETHPTTNWKSIKETCKSLIITHTITVKASIGGCALIIARLPHGPTLHFNVSSFCTSKDLKEFYEQQDLKFQSSFSTRTAPLVVLNNFNSVSGGDDKTSATVKLMAVTFQNMFPAVDVRKFNLSQTKRVVMFNYDPEEECVHLRHYSIALKEEMDEKAGKKKEKVSLRELGPRVTMSLRMVTEGVMDGEMIYNKDSTLTPKQIEELRKKKAEKRALKEQRKKDQEQNVQRKKSQKEQQKKKKDVNEEVKAAWEKKLARAGTENEDDEDDDDDEDGEGNASGGEDDFETVSTDHPSATDDMSDDDE